MRLTFACSAFRLFQLRRIVSLILMIVLTANPILAMPGGVISLGNEVGYSLAFWWYNSGWAAKFAQKSVTTQDTKGWDGKGAPPNVPPAPRVQEKQADRDRRVSRLEISPRDVTIHTGEKVIFAALAYDREGQLVPSIKVTWKGSDEDKKRKMKVSDRGVFTSPVPGHYRVTVSALNKQDSVRVTVIGEVINPKDPGVKGEPISTKDAPKETKPAKISVAPRLPRESAPLRKSSAAQLAGRMGKALRAASAPIAITTAFQSGYDYYTWNSSNYAEADDPNKTRGDMPGHALNGGAGSGNFQFSAPLIGLEGRGIDVNLSMNYNSRLWHKSGSDMYFDVDGDYVPGWNFGFGRIVTAGNGYMLIDADGSRHSYGGNPWSYSAPNTSLQGFDGYTMDGTFINYWARGYRPQYGSYILDAWAKLPNGTKIVYGASANLSAYPTQITDANGNYITITYVSNQGPNIDTITDTLGRQVKFKYAAYNGKDVVVAVTAPGFNGGSDRVVARFAYETVDLTTAGTNYGFSGVTCRVQNSTITRLKAIYYPATKTGYWFGSSSETSYFSKYGMIRKISERRAMNCTNPTSTTAQAAFTGDSYSSDGSGVMSREMVYEHTSLAGYSDTAGPLTDVPTYNRMTEDWAGRHSGSPYNIPKPVTEYSVSTNSSTITTRITRGDSSQTTIDGRTTEQVSDNNPSSATYGLLLEDTTYPDKTSSTVKSKSKVYWEVPDLNTYPSHYGTPRPNHTEITDERNQTTTTYYDYGVNYNQVADVREYGWNNQLLRRTHTDYINTTAYIGYWSNNAYGSYFGRHIYSLVSAVSVYSTLDDSVRVSRTEYQYDQQSGQGLFETPSVTMHELISDPYDPGETYCDYVWNDLTSSWDYVCNTTYTYDSSTDKRGNVTSVKRYADAQNYGSDPIPMVETRSYDVCGNLRIASTSCCEQAAFDYTSTTQYAWPTTQTRGAASDATKRIATSAVYDFNTGLVTSATDANGRTSTVTYNTSTLRPILEYTPTNGYAYHEYYDDAMIVVDFVYKAGLDGPNWSNRVDKYLDGYGRITGEIGFTAGYEMDVVATIYDHFGRVKTQSRPYRLNTSWALVGTQEWTNYNYDILDRVTSVVAPDGSTTYRYYNETSYPSGATAGGTTLRVEDAWNRERWARFDEQNRLVEVVEPDPAGTGAVASNGLLTSYSYNTLGNLTDVTQGTQNRNFKYDSLGRLTNQKLAEREAQLNDSGGNGSTWSDYFKYDNRGNLIERVDARRVKTTFNYNSDPLNRLYQVTYDKSNAINASTIAAAATVTYIYEATSGKDNTRLLGLELGAPNSNTTDFGEQSFGYDSEGRLSSVVQSYGSGRSATTSYEYDTLDRVSKVYYPAQTGQSGNPIRNAVPTYDLASRLQSLTYNSTTMADNPVYNASSQTTQLDVGSAIQEQYTFDPQTGLLTGQKVKQGSTAHVDLEYNYTLTNATNNVGAKTGQLAFIKDNKNTERNRKYVYDTLGRLKEAKGGASFTRWSQAYAYDRWGNRTGVTKSGVDANNNTMVADGLTSVNYFAASNRIDKTDFTYDAAGNQTKSDENGLVNTYKYDAAGRLAEVSNSVGTHTYAYGASNQRLQSVEVNGSTTTTLYAWAGGSVIAEYNGASSGMAWTKSYVYLGGRLLATEVALTSTTTETKYQHPDRLGTRLVTNTSGGVVSENIGLPFGTILAGESTSLGSSATKKRFTSYDRSDSTTLDYAVNRHYSAAQGRFTQVDPIEMDSVSLEDPQSLNLYAYCANDPINCLDPDGLFLKKLFGGIKKFFSNIIVRIAVVVALTIISLGLLGPLVAPTVVGTMSIGGTATVAITSGVHLTLTGWFAVGLSALSGISFPTGLGGFGATTPPFNPQAFNPPSGGTGGRRGGTGGGGRGNPPPARHTAWARIWRELMRGTRVAPPRPPSPRIPDPQILAAVNQPANQPYALHHLFPQQASLRPYFTNAGIPNVHETTILIPQWLHLNLHRGARGGYWNTSWEGFFNQNPTATRDQIFREANRLIRLNNMSQYPVFHY